MVRLRVFGLRVFLPRQSVTDPHSFVHQKNVYLPMNRISVTTNPKSDDLSRALFVLYTVWCTLIEQLGTSPPPVLPTLDPAEVEQSLYRRRDANADTLRPYVLYRVSVYKLYANHVQKPLTKPICPFSLMISENVSIVSFIGDIHREYSLWILLAILNTTQWNTYLLTKQSPNQLWGRLLPRCFRTTISTDPQEYGGTFQSGSVLQDGCSATTAFG